ncbi:hypothetical protein [Agaribacter flavus]|uniref:Uncharacterized protein n=1 Tax=Agaribacter flavus TaxID=1902781 RepID=A0ABV7FMY7_9ALTE
MNYIKLCLMSLVLLGINQTVHAQMCDVDANGIVDRQDVSLIFQARGQSPTPSDPRDANADGVINLFDARQCVTQCDLPRCETPIAPPPTNQTHVFSGFSSSIEGWQPWVTDGTPEGTFKLKQINTNGSSVMPIGDYFDFNGAHYFFASTQSFRDAELWRSDGTSAGTTQVSNLGQSINLTIGSAGCFAGEKLLVNAFNTNTGFTQAFAFQANGTIEQLDESSVNCGNSTNIDDQSTYGTLYFANFSTDINENAIHISDGSSVELLGSQANPVTRPDRMISIGSNIFYFSRTGSSHTTLMVVKSDGSDATALKNFTGIDSTRVEARDSRLQQIVFNGKLYFNANDGISGFSLWESDGTPSGTKLVKDLDNSPDSTEIAYMRVLGNKFIFKAEGAASGIWISDGTEAGTQKVSNILPLELVENTFYPPIPVVMDGKYFFTAGPAGNHELWVSDGTTAGTQIVRDINIGGSSSPVSLVAQDRYILFAAMATEEQGFELWRSDGTNAGTFLLKDICPDPFCNGMIDFAF